VQPIEAEVGGFISKLYKVFKPSIGCSGKTWWKSSGQTKIIQYMSVATMNWSAASVLRV